MNRQSFERWIFQGEAPSKGEAQLVAPAPGFSRRWLQRWEAEQAHSERVRAFWLAFLSSLGVVIGLGFMVAQNLPLLSEPSSLITNFVNGVVEFFAFLTVFFRVGGSLLRVTPSSVWLALASLASLAALFSVLALNRFVMQKGAIR